MLYFGEPWDAPICDEIERFPEVPTYAKCVGCHELFGPDDQGFILPHDGRTDPDYAVGFGNGYTLVGEHRLCMLRDVLGPAGLERLPLACPDGPHRAPQGPNEDVGQCPRCFGLSWEMRPDGETFGHHLPDCSLPRRHESYCRPGGDGHAPAPKIRG